MSVIKFRIPPGFNIKGKGTFFDSDEVRRRLKGKYPQMADETKKAQYVLGAITYDDTTGLVTIEINTPNTALMTEGQKQTIKNEIASWVEFMGWEADSA